MCKEVIVAVWNFAVKVGKFAWVRALDWYMIDFRLENLYVYDGTVGLLDFEHAIRGGTLLTRLAEAYIQFLKDATCLLPVEYHQRWQQVHGSVRHVSRANYCLEAPYVHRYFAEFTDHVYTLFGLPRGLQQQQTYPRPAGGLARMFSRSDVEALFAGGPVMTPVSVEEPSPVDWGSPHEAAAAPGTPLSPLTMFSSLSPGDEAFAEVGAAEVLSPVEQDLAEVDFAAEDAMIDSADPEQAALAVTPPSPLRGDAQGHDAALGGDPRVVEALKLPVGLSEEEFRQRVPQLGGPWYEIYKLMEQHSPEYLEHWGAL